MTSKRAGCTRVARRSVGFAVESTSRPAKHTYERGSREEDKKHTHGKRHGADDVLGETGQCSHVLLSLRRESCISSNFTLDVVLTLAVLSVEHSSAHSIGFGRRGTYASEEDGARSEMQIHEVECDPTLQVPVDAIDRHLYARMSVTGVS